MVLVEDWWSPLLNSIVFLFETEITEGGDPADRVDLSGECSVLDLHASLILVIALPETKENTDPG
jgi:hypothetical protein